MGRDTLRQLEDEHLRLGQAELYGKSLLGIKWGLWTLRQMIKMQKEINVLKEKLK